jgi:TRAP-type mannitol/chloroaromatic compound transport system substrate-binding protein
VALGSKSVLALVGEFGGGGPELYTVGNCNLSGAPMSRTGHLRRVPHHSKNMKRGLKGGWVMKKIVVFVFCVMFMCVLFVSVPSTGMCQQVFKWRAQHLLPSQMETYKEFARWCDHIKKASGGRLEIKPFPVGTIVPHAEQWEAVRKGVIEMALSYGAFWVGKTPMAGFSVGIPFTLRDTQDHYVLHQRLGLEDLVRASYAKQNIYFLRQNPCLAAVMTSRKPVTSVADLKGLKIRATGMVGEMLAEAGAAVMFVPGPEIYEALEKGVVDAAVYGPLISQYEAGFHEVTKYVIMPPFAIEGDETIVNMDAWKALPEDLKMLLYLSNAEHTARIAALYRYDSEKALETFLKKGCKISYMPEAERQKLTELGWKVVDKYSAKDPDFAKAAGILKDYLKLTGVVK